MPATGTGYQDPFEGVEITAEIAVIADVDRIALEALNGLGDRHAAHRGLNDLLDIADVDAVAGRLQAVDLDIEIVAADHPLGDGREGPRHGPHHGLDLLADAAQSRQIVAHDLDADRGLDAGREHIDAGLDRHGPGVGQTRKLDGAVEFVGELFNTDGHMLRPEPGAAVF